MIAMPGPHRPDESIQNTKAVLAIFDKLDADGYLVMTVGSEMAVVSIAIAANARDFFIAWRNYRSDQWWTLRTTSIKRALPTHVKLVDRLERDELIDVRKEVARKQGGKA